MLKRLGSLVAFSLLWLIAALALPIVFWVIGGLILGGTLLHVVLGKDGFGPGHRFFTIVSAVTLLLATAGFFAGGGATEPETGLADVNAALAVDDDDADAGVDAGDTAEDAGDVAEDGDVPDAGGATTDIPVEDAGPVDVKAALKTATATAKKGKDCKSLDAVAAAWLDLSRVPNDDEQFAKAKKAAVGLEKCRKGAVAALKKTAVKTRIKERTTLAKSLQKLLGGMGLKLKAKVAGKAKDKVTFKGKKASEEKIDEAFAAGATDPGTLLGRLQAAGFANVTVAAGKVKRDYALATETDDAAALARIEELGMSEPLALE